VEALMTAHHLIGIPLLFVIGFIVGWVARGYAQSVDADQGKPPE